MNGGVRPSIQMLRFILLIVFGLLGLGLAMNKSGVQNDLRALSDSLTFHKISALGPIGDLFAFGALLPWFFAVGIASTLVLGRLAYWTTPISISFSIMQSFLLLHPSFQWEGSTFANTMPDVIICYCAIPMSFASISITTMLRDIRQVRLSLRDYLAAIVFVAVLCGATAVHSPLGFSLALLVTSTWIAYLTMVGQNKAGRTNDCNQALD